jgi:hypothetical protein
LAIALAGCATTQSVTLPTLTSYQKAQMASLGFMERYAKQLKDAWDLSGLISSGRATEGQKAVYEVKRKLLIKAEPLVLGFDKLVKDGVTPGADKEFEVNSVLNELAAAIGQTSSLKYRMKLISAECVRRTNEKFAAGGV